jgi:hypothetical protein
MNMTAKQLAARAVMAAVMAAGLSACGGGGDGAAPAPAASTPEILTAGLTLRDAIGESPANGKYTVNIFTILTNSYENSPSGFTTIQGVNTYAFSNDQNARNFGGSISVDGNGTVVRAMLYGSNLQDKPMACGISGINNPCTGFKVDLVNKSFSATSVVLKAVNPTWSGLSSTPGQVTVSGIVTP